MDIKPLVNNKPPAAPIVASFGQASMMFAQREREAQAAIEAADAATVAALCGDAGALVRETKPFEQPKTLAPAIQATMSDAVNALLAGRLNKQTTPTDVIAASIRRAQMANEARAAEADADALRLAAATARLAASANTISELPTAAS
jgi:hypothetical protein